MNYSAAEIIAVGDGLREGLTASQIADRLSARRHATVTRNAIIGLVHRNETLKAIGFRRSPGLMLSESATAILALAAAHDGVSPAALVTRLVCARANAIGLADLAGVPDFERAAGSRFHGRDHAAAAAPRHENVATPTSHGEPPL